jgi:hemolysin-activating ACP:hemolysin acyltransferase
MRQRMNQAALYSDRNNKIKAFSGWRNVYREIKKEHEEENNNRRVELEVKDIVAKYQK